MKHLSLKISFCLLLIAIFSVSQVFAQSGSGCFAPGNLVINDPSGESVAAPQYDIKSVYISEPFFSDGSDKLIISLRVNDLSNMPPASWNVLFAGPDNVSRFVQMNSLDGPPVFNYGTVSGMEGVPNFAVEGQIPGKFNNAGDITFTLDKGLIGNPVDGQTFNFSGRVYTKPLTDLREEDATSLAGYSLAGNAGCSQSLFVQFGLNGDVAVGNDYSGNGTSDLAVWRPASGIWYARDSVQADVSGLALGNASNGDIPVPGDYDNDSKGDYAVYRPSEGNWYLFNTETRTFETKQFGIAGDIPLSGDFDADGVDDLVCWRPSNGTWYINASDNAQVQIMQFGTSGDRPVAGDFDGDLKSDIGVFRPSTGEWFVWQSGLNSLKAVKFGVGSDEVVPADYDGDGRTDFAVFRPGSGNWYVLYNNNSGYNIMNWGTSGDRVVPGDYNGNGRADYAVWRPSNGVWYVYYN